MYPTRDTYSGDNVLDGYSDSLFFDMHIFDPKEKRKWVLENRDGISLLGAPVINAGVFKDGSSFLRLAGPLKIDIFASPCILPIKE